MRTIPATSRRKFLPVLIAGALAPGLAAAATAPSSSDTPYLVSLDAGVDFTSLLTAGDTVRRMHKGNLDYAMVGIPDGLGAWDNGDGTITVLMNQELGSSLGVIRDHGGKGAFVSRWQVRKSDLKVLAGEDQIKDVRLWNGTAFAPAAGVIFNRFCSADLPASTALYNRDSGKGLADGRLFLNGEETAAGRAMAHVATGRDHGTSYELPRFGRAAWENLIASPFEQDKTIVAGDDDGPLNGSKVYFYVGQKQASGSPVDQAGLNNGSTWQLSVTGYATESAGTPIPNGYSGRFNLGAAGTGFNRVEDGAWDTVNPNRYYFVTTASFTGNTRLWRLTFDDIHHPEGGGNIQILVDGAVTGQKMLDNITVDRDGNVYMLEDVGNQPHLGRIWEYSAANGTTRLLAQHDPLRFIAGAPADIDGSDSKQSDEESSGIVDLSALFDGVPGYDTVHNNYLLLDVQAHYTSVNGVPVPVAQVEGGQLLLMRASR